jgi:DNA-binding transcriptional LysR family regulator
MPEYAPLPVTLRQLQYVLAVAETGSFHGAAARCHVSQPGLSTQVKALEEALGVTVFERAPRAVRVTAEGERVLERARRLLDEAVALAEDARQCRDPFARALSVGVIPTVAPYVLTRVTPALRAAHPALRVRWVEDKTSALVRDIAAGVLDGALLALEAELPGMATAEVTRDPFVLACAPSHPLARRRAKVTLDDVRGLDLLLLDEGSLPARPGAQPLPRAPRRGAALSRHEPRDAGADGGRGRRRDAAAPGRGGGREPRVAARAAPRGGRHPGPHPGLRVAPRRARGRGLRGPRGHRPTRALVGHHVDNAAPPG